MLITMLKSKIHRVKVTDCLLDYEGSCGISTDLLEAAYIREYEQVHIYNINNGERFTTYAISANPGIISVRGAAARKAMPGDILVICTYGQVSDDSEYTPIKIYVDDNNVAYSYDIEYYDSQDIETCQGVLDREHTIISAISEEYARVKFNNIHCDDHIISKVTRI